MTMMTEMLTPPSDDPEEANVQRQRQKGGLNITMMMMNDQSLIMMNDVDDHDRYANNHTD